MNAGRYVPPEEYEESKTWVAGHPGSHDTTGSHHVAIGHSAGQYIEAKWSVVIGPPSYVWPNEPGKWADWVLGEVQRVRASLSAAGPYSGLKGA